MKMLVAFILFAVAPAYAGTDSMLSKMWQYTSSKDNFHMLDNMTAATFYDFSSKEFLTGGTTALYHPKGISLDVGVAKSIAQGQNALPVVGAKLHARELLELMGQDRIVELLNFKTGIAKYGTGGLWYARDFYNGAHRYGGFLGAKLDF